MKPECSKKSMNIAEVFGTVAMMPATAQLGMIGSAAAQSIQQPKAGRFAHDQARAQQAVRLAEADRYGRPECRLRPSRSSRWG